jgi:hypothetical protein
MYPDLAGVVEDWETICRGAFTAPVNNYNARGEIKPNLITEGRLLAGQLSVYRASEKAQFSVEEVAEQLTGSGVVLKEIYATTAVAVRSLSVSGFSQRMFCIVDDCVIDNLGTTHRAHAHILICQEVARQLRKGDEGLVRVRDRLFLLFKQCVAWRA